MRITEGYLVSRLQFREVKSDPGTAVNPQDGMYYRDKDTWRIFAYDNTAKEFRDISFFQGYKYTEIPKYDDATQTRIKEKRIDSNHIYLAKPGQRILGVINGIDEDSCSLTKKLNNTSELTFDVERIIDRTKRYDDDGNKNVYFKHQGEETQLYDLIERHYELYIPYHGWFKINEEPEVDNDGTVETKSVRAESLEIELQQYDLVNFEINSGELHSKEMLATDNTYDNNGYKMFRDRVLFYRDTTLLEAAIEEFAETDGSVEALKEFAKTHAEIIYQDLGDGIHTGCWRITYKDDKVEIESKIDPDDEESGEYTGTEILENELKRQHELSLLWLILHEHGWSVGYVDPYMDLQSDVDDDKIPLANKTGFFQVDSQDIYSFLTQEVAGFFRCIFVFDTENYLVHAYNINNIGYDTNIFLSFQNVQNEVTRTSDRDLHTVFHVQGADELDFTEANFGEDWIEDISYFMEVPGKHFSEDFIKRYENWQNLRTQKRPEYLQLSIDYRNQNDVVKELYSRVPTDAADGDQYKTMTEDELINEKANMRALRYGFEHGKLYIKRDGNGDPVLDEDGNTIFDIELIKKSVDWPVYSSLVDIVLSYPDDTEEEKDDAINNIIFIQGEKSDDYKYDFDPTFKGRYPKARLGNIDIALLNRRIIDGYYTQDGMTDEEKRKRTNVKNQKEFLDNYKFDFKNYGYLYGLDELQNYEKSYYGTLSALDSNGYGEKSDGTPYEDETSKKYEKYKKALEEVQAEIEVRQQEVDTAEAALDAIKDQMDAMKEAVSIDKAGFTDEELKLLDKYYLHTDYVNQNILTTNISTNEEIVKAENQLYLDAMEELYVESHPQYTWSTTQDNLLLMPEFHDWHGDLHVGNFIRISFRDNYQVKLRVSSITLNPLMLEPTIQLEFTTMTQYKSKRNDFAAILDQANTSAKNSITSTISRNKGTDNQINVDSALIMKLLNSSTFQGYMGSNNANITGSTITAVSGNIEQIAADTISAMDISVTRIKGEQAEFDELFTKYLKSNLIVTKMINAEDADIEHLTAKVIDVGGTQITDGLIKTAELSADQIKSGTIDTDRINVNDVITVGTDKITTIAGGVVSTAEISADQIKSGTINTDRINVQDVITVGTDAITTIAEGTITTENVVATLVNATSGDFDSLTADSAFVQYLNSGIIEAGTVSADTVIAALVEAQEGDFDNLTADSAFIKFLNANLITASEIRVDDLKAKLATIDQLNAESAFVKYLQSLSSTAAQATITEGYIMNLVSGRITVADLATHTATADEIILISQDNNPSIAFKGSTQQFYDSDGNVRVQIGQDGNGDFNFIVKGEDGTTALFDENGITRNGIPNSTIINNMISDSTIEKAKLNFPIVETNPDGTINITSIKDGSGGNFGIEYTTFKQGTTDALDEINSKKMYRIDITSSNGNYFKNGNVSTVLSCHVYSWDDEITDDLNASAFKWTKINNDGTPDSAWNTAHFGGAKTVTITSADVDVRGTFVCTVTLPDGTKVSSGD